MDDEILRGFIPKQLNKGENIHKFARAVSYANGGEIRSPSREEQLLGDGCKRLIQNVIICWNYFYLKNLIFNTPILERPNIIKAIKESSPVHWAHVNLHGTFDFSKEGLKDSLDFDIEKLINFDWKGENQEFEI